MTETPEVLKTSFSEDFARLQKEASAPGALCVGVLNSKQQFTLIRPDETEGWRRFTYPPLSENTIPGKHDSAGNLLPPDKKYDDATTPRLCSLMSRFATSCADVRLVAKTLREWYEETGTNDQPSKALTNRAITSLMVANMIHCESEELQENTHLLIKEFTTIQSIDDGKYSALINKAITSTLAKIFVESRTTTSLMRQMQEIDSDTFASSIAMYEDAGFKSQNFWSEYGINTGGVINKPGMLHHLFDKIVTQKDPELLPSGYEAQTSAQVYGEKVLSSYLYDSNRNAKNITDILKKIRLNEYSISIEAFENLASRVFAPGIISATGLDVKNEHPFMWILHMSVPNKHLSQAVRIDQLKEDIQHATVMETLLGRATLQQDFAVDWESIINDGVAVRFYDRTKAQQEDIVTQLKKALTH